MASVDELRERIGREVDALLAALGDLYDHIKGGTVSEDEAAGAPQPEPAEDAAGDTGEGAAGSQEPAGDAGEPAASSVNPDAQGFPGQTAAVEAANIAASGEPPDPGAANPSQHG